MPRFTGACTTGLPAKRPRSRTSTSLAKITASARRMRSGSSGVMPAEPCVSTCRSTPSFFAAFVSASAAMYVWAMPVAQEVMPTSSGRPESAAAAAAAGATCGSSAVARSTSATMSSGVRAARRAAVKSSSIRDRASFESSCRCSWSAPSGAAMKKTMSAGPSKAPKETGGRRRAIASVGSVTAAERQCGIAMPPGTPVSVFCSRAHASA